MRVLNLELPLCKPSLSLVCGRAARPVEQIPTLGALSPRGEPVQDPVLTPGDKNNFRRNEPSQEHRAVANTKTHTPIRAYRGTSPIRKCPPPLGPPWDPRHRPTVGSSGGAFSCTWGTSVGWTSMRVRVRVCEIQGLLEIEDTHRPRTLR